MDKNDEHLENYNEDNKSLFVIFSFIYGFYVAIHSLYVYQQSGETDIVIFFTPLLSFLLLLKPSSVLRFMLVAFGSFISIWSVFPSTSNSTFLTLTLDAVIIFSYLSLVIQHKTLKIDSVALFNVFAPGARVLLLILYFYGVFQKVNTGFTNPEFSCGADFLNHFRFLPDWFINSWQAQYSAIYGTYIVETVIAFMLLFPKSRYWGIILGGGFHFMLAFNTYQYFHTFTTLAMLMHFLYLDPRTLSRLKSSGIGQFFIVKPYRFKLIPFVLTPFIGYFIWVFLSDGSIYDAKYRAIADITWFPIGLSLWVFPLLFDRLKKGEKEYNFPQKNFYISPKIGVNIIVIAYFFFCLGPYFGLKSEQALNMYSNLRVTHDFSNHYVFQKPINIFSNQKEIVKVISSNNAFLNRTIKRKHVMFKLHFFDYLARHPDIEVKYIYNGKEYDHKGATEEQIKEWKRSYLAYKLLSLYTYPEDLSDMHCRSFHI